jgi:hypothetical protein
VVGRSYRSKVAAYIQENYDVQEELLPSILEKPEHRDRIKMGREESRDVSIVGNDIADEEGLRYIG